MVTSTDPTPRKRRRAAADTEDDAAPREHGPQESGAQPPPAAPLDNLVPIRLDLTVDGHRIHDRFCWAPSENSLTPTAFATQLAADLGLPPAVVAPVAEQITEQLDAHAATVAAAAPPATVATTATTSSASLAPPSPSSSHAPSSPSPPPPPHAQPPPPPPPPPPRRERRHVVRLDVRIGRVVLRDMFEWDLNAGNSADAYAERVCADVGLRSEHVAAVAHALRERLADLAGSDDAESGGNTVAPLRARDAVRTPRDAERWQPRLQYLTTEQRERLERKEKREARLQRRNRGKADPALAGAVARARPPGVRSRRSSGVAASGTPAGRRRR